MKRFVKYLRRQPEDVRKSLLHLAMIVIAIILVALWVYSLGSNLSDPDTQTRIKEDVKPLSAIKDNLNSPW